jgi:hypothetical protein
MASMTLRTEVRQLACSRPFQIARSPLPEYFLSLVFFIRAGQGEYDIENWRALYLRPQWKQEANPKFAAMCDNWDLASSYAPQLVAEAQSVHDQLAQQCAYKTTDQWDATVPYARVCIPTKVGMKKGISPDAYMLRVNPFGSPETDYTSKTFYKAMIQNGQIYNSYCGAAMH